MADVAQWTADVFWNQLNQIAAAAQQQKSQLDAQKLVLQNAYSKARAAGDSALMAKLDPLINDNSTLRLRRSDLATQFNALANDARDLLEQHGVHEPAMMAGLGQLQAILIPIAWVAGITAVWAIVHEINDGIKRINDGLGPLAPIGDLFPLVIGIATVLFGVYFLKRKIHA